MRESDALVSRAAEVMFLVVALSVARYSVFNAVTVVEQEKSVPLLWTGVVRHHPPTGGPTRSSADVSVPRLAGFSLIT